MIGAVLLAAGRSRRFGYADKRLAAWGDRPLVIHALDTLARAPAIRCVVVVLGPRDRGIEARCRRSAPRGTRIRFAHVDGPAAGLSVSLRTGLARLPAACDAALIALADTPGVDGPLLRRLMAGHRPDIDAVRPVRGERPGHPVLVSRVLFDALANQQGDRGGLAVLRRWPSARRLSLPVAARRVLDVDTPAALRAARRRDLRHGPGRRHCHSRAIFNASLTHAG